MHPKRLDVFSFVQYSDLLIYSFNAVIETTAIGENASRCVIGANVEIGTNTCIDRGTLWDTIIEDGVKIDNLCHIAHNVKIGKQSECCSLSLLG